MKVALAGLGHMGLPIAERVLKAGHELTVYNRTKGKADGLVAEGAVEADDVAPLLDVADVCITVLADDAALAAVLLNDDGCLAGARRGTTLIDMSTVSLRVSAQVADAADGAGVSYLRAPVSGNPSVVRAGNLTIVLSGARAAADAAMPLLQEIGPTVHYVGNGESARVVKLALQVMIGGTAQLMAEALTLAEAGGVAPGTLLAVMGESAAGSPFVRYKTEPLLAGDYSATFTTEMMKKDLDLVLDFADEHAVPLPLARRLDSEIGEAIDRGFGELDFMALYLQQRELAGLAGTVD
jgi:3-hydroxyisobutyrate dehydrogenase-like beta-hydroxyacid dehydrogenase